MNAPSDYFQSFLQVHALLPVSVEHRQYEAGSIAVRAKVDLGKGSHVVHVVQRHPILRIISGQQKVGLIRTFSKGSGELTTRGGRMLESVPVTSVHGKI